MTSCKEKLFKIENSECRVKNTQFRHPCRWLDIPPKLLIFVHNKKTLSSYQQKAKQNQIMKGIFCCEESYYDSVVIDQLVVGDSIHKVLNFVDRPEVAAVVVVPVLNVVVE